MGVVIFWQEYRRIRRLGDHNFSCNEIKGDITLDFKSCLGVVWGTFPKVKIAYKSSYKIQILYNVHTKPIQNILKVHTKVQCGIFV